MVSPTSRAGESAPPCDFCNERAAVLLCRADSAKLCLFCDQQVHSANLLSRKHTRSQICENCGSVPVSVRCSTDNLLLCQDCDWDAHGSCPVSSPHDRTPVEGFSGCPSALELAALWGLDLDGKDQIPLMQQQGGGAVFGFQDLIVPGSDNPLFLPDIMRGGGILSSSKRVDPICERSKQAIHVQLLELSKQEAVMGSVGEGGGMSSDNAGGSGGENIVPGTPSRNAWEGEIDRIGDGEYGAGAAAGSQVLPQQGTFTSLLMLPGLRDLRESAQVVETLWEANSSGAAQIWDFNLGRMRGHEEPDVLEVGYEANNAGFTIKSYGDLIRESSFKPAKGLEEIYHFGSSIAHGDNMASFNNQNQAASQGQEATSESNNLPAANPPNNPIAVKPKGFAAATTKADMDLLAQHRGNAMLRYKEKKKTRRSLCHLKTDPSPNFPASLFTFSQILGHLASSFVNSSIHWLEVETSRRRKLSLGETHREREEEERERRCGGGGETALYC